MPSSSSGRLCIAAIALVGTVAVSDAKCTKSQWFSATRKFNTDKLKACLADDASGNQMDVRDEAGCPAIVIAALNRNLDALKFFHDQGADMHAKCTTGSTVLSHAAATGNMDIIKYLHGKGGVDVQEATGPNGWTALTIAARSGQMAVLKYLHKLDGVFGADWSGSALMFAAAVGEEEMLANLLKKSADAGPDGVKQGTPGMDDVDEHGISAAVWAAQRGSLKTLTMLGEAGANLGSATNNGMNGVMSAAYFGHSSTVTYLLEHGVDIDAQDKAGWTAVMWAAAGGHTSTVEVLHKRGACMKPKQGKWDSLMVAAASGHYDVVEWLLAKGALYTNVNHARKSAEKLAFENGHDEIADLLGRIGEINAWHAENERKGRRDAAAREKALRDEAHALAKKEAKVTQRRVSEELIQKHVSKLTASRGQEEKIAKLRDIMHEKKVDKKVAQDLPARPVPTRGKASTSAPPAADTEPSKPVHGEL